MGAEGLAWGEEEVGRTKEKEGGFKGKAGMGWDMRTNWPPFKAGGFGLEGGAATQVWGGGEGTGLQGEGRGQDL